MVLLESFRPVSLLYLCASCKEIFSRSHEVTTSLFFPNEDDGYKLHQTKATFEQALTEGCRLCSLIWYKRWTMEDDKTRPWDDWDDLAPSDDIDLRYGFTSGTSGYQHSMGFWRGKDTKEPNIRRSFFLPLEEISDELAHAFQKEEPSMSESTSSKSRKSLSAAKDWLEHCLAKHSCSSTQNPAWAPTRLIDVGNGLEEPPRVVLTSLLEPGLQWITLSHCWGDVAKQCKLLTGNLTQYLEVLPSRELSDTFLDALTITRALGFRYLWIDSLCIIQDDMDDWSREATFMHQIYSLSSCTISASHAVNGEGGCFSQRNPRLIFPCVMPLPFKSQGGQSYCKLHAVSLDERWKTNIRHGPLYQRAWVYQERLLSPRTLYFGKEQILWGCSELETCESFDQGHPDSGWGYSSDRKRFADLVRKRSLANDAVDRSWSDIIREYSATKISFPKDRLLAFTGLMETLNTNRTTPHSFGVWLDESVAWSLLWSETAKTGDATESRPTEPIAPSWSWLSLQTPATFSQWLIGRSMVKALAFMETNNRWLTSTTVLRQPDVLIIRACLTIAWFRKGDPYSNGTPRCEMGYTQDQEEELVEFEEPDSLLSRYESKLKTKIKDKLAYHETFLMDVRDHMIEGNVIFCMPTVNHEDHLYRFEGIVLEPLGENPQLRLVVNSESEPGFTPNRTSFPTFRRVGRYHIMHKAHWVARTSAVEIALI